jgi:hypothetical protein
MLLYLHHRTNRNACISTHGVDQDPMKLTHVARLDCVMAIYLAQVVSVVPANRINQNSPVIDLVSFIKL